MGFSVPDFPIECDIWAGPWESKVLRSGGVPCNLAWGKRVGFQYVYFAPEAAGNGVVAAMTLLLPALTDIRAFPTYPVSDFVEVPSGSGRWYWVAYVDDLGKGFENEHRGAIIAQISATSYAPHPTFPAWPVPMT